MVSTRNAAPSASLNRPKTSRGGRKSAAPPSVSLSSTAVLPESSPPNDSHPTGSRLRKRGRDESISNNDAPVSSGPSLGDQTSRSKRAKIQARPAEPSRRTRRTVQSAAQNVPVSTIQYTAVGAGQLSFDTPMPSEVTANDSDHQGFGAMSMDDSTRISLQGLQLRNQSLPVLDNFATQILSVSATNSFHEIFDIATNPQTGPGQQWSQLITLFSETKKVYANHDPFLSPQRLGFFEKAHIDVIRKANMATFVCGLFGGRQDVGFRHLNESFLDTFVTESPIMLESHAQLFLELKTQAYISAVTNDKAAIISGHRSRQETLDALFPSQLGDDLLLRRSRATQFTPTESELVERAKSRRQALFKESDSEEAINTLPSKYPWEDFLQDVHSHIASTFNNMTGRMSPKASQDTRISNIDTSNRKTQAHTASHGLQGTQGPRSHDSLGLEATQLQAIPSTSNDVAEKAARAAHYAMTNFGTIEQQRPAVQRGPQASQQRQASIAGPPIQFHFERPLHPNVPSPPAPSFTQVPYQNDQMQGQWHPNSGADGQLHQLYDADGMIPYPTQSAPTHVLYERARQAASTKPSQHQTPRKTITNTPTQRRPWTAEEENALMAGLDRVKGPHWSQIHAMFGPGGTINEVLKNRSQVQLKDKARNLKLFFLKGNIEVPYYLQFVTGELKTRAPSRLAKNEAKGRMMSEEDRAHVQGVMTLAGTANAMQEEDQSNLIPGNVHGERDRNELGLSDSVGNDVNIDPALEAQLRNAAGGVDMVYSSRYTVPTPNMILESLDRFSGAQDTQQQSQR